MIYRVEDADPNPLETSVRMAINVDEALEAHFILSKVGLAITGDGSGGEGNDFFG